MLARVIHVFGNQHLVHPLALRTGLGGDELHAQNLLGDLLNLFATLGQFHAAAFAPASGVDLGFHHKPFGAGFGVQFAGGFHGRLGRVGHDALLHFYSVALE